MGMFITTPNRLGKQSKITSMRHTVQLRGQHPKKTSGFPKKLHGTRIRYPKGVG